MSQFIEMFGDPITNPKSWPVMSMKESSVLLSDGPFGSNLKTEHYCEEGIRVIRLQNICLGYFDDTDKAYVSVAHYEKLKKYTCKPGEIVIGTLGEPNFRACIIPSYIELSINKADCVHYIPKVNLLNNIFACAYINCERTLQMATSNIHGTTRARIAAGQVNSIPIYIPPMDIQKQFVAIAEQADKSEFDGFKSQFIEMFGSPENNHKDYPIIKIGDMVESINYGTSKPANDNGKYVYLRMNNITYDGKLDLSEVKRIDLSLEDDESAFVHKGDLMFNRTNTKEFVGKTTVFNLDEPMVVAGYIIRVRFKDIITPEYVSGYLNSTYGKALLRKMAKGAVHQANINAQEFQGIRILDVPKHEQNKFVTILQQADKSENRCELRIAS